MYMKGGLFASWPFMCLGTDLKTLWPIVVRITQQTQYIEWIQIHLSIYGLYI